MKMVNPRLFFLLYTKKCKCFYKMISFTFLLLNSPISFTEKTNKKLWKSLAILNCLLIKILQKILSYRFGRSGGWINDDRIFIFGRTLNLYWAWSILLRSFRMLYVYEEINTLNNRMLHYSSADSTKICSLAINIVFHLSNCLQPKTLRPWGTSFCFIYLFFCPSGCQTSLFLSIRVCCLTVSSAVFHLSFLLLWVSSCNDRLQVVLTAEVAITCWSH